MVIEIITTRLLVLFLLVATTAYAQDRSGLADTEKRLWPWFVLAAALFLFLEWALPL